MTTVNKDAIRVWPAGRRNTNRFAHLTSETALTKIISSLSPSGDGTFIATEGSYALLDTTTWIEFFIQGYYFAVLKSAIETIRGNNTNIYASIKLDALAEIPFEELIGFDDASNLYTGLDLTTSEPAAAEDVATIHLIVPGTSQGVVQFNTAIQTSTLLTPFVISARKSGVTDPEPLVDVLKTQIWIDNTNNYFVPYIQTEILNSSTNTLELKWVPLGAVYK